MARLSWSSLSEPPLPRPRVPSVVPGAPVRGGRRFRHTPSQARSAKKGLAGRLTAGSVGSSWCGPPRASRAPCLCATVSPHRCVSDVCHSTGVSAANPQPEPSQALVRDPTHGPPASVVRITGGQADTRQTPATPRTLERSARTRTGGGVRWGERVCVSIRLKESCRRDTSGRNPGGKPDSSHPRAVTCP